METEGPTWTGRVREAAVGALPPEWHVLLLPLAIAFLIGIHVLLVRRRGVVPPLPLQAEKAEDT